MSKNIKFKYADAWVLLAVIFASKQGGATLTKVIAWGDFINHAIFTLEELQGGIYRLIKAGYITEDNNGYKPTQEIMKSYTKFAMKDKAVHNALQCIREEIDSPDWTEGYDPTKANKGISYEKINQETYKKAYKEYCDGI